MMPNTTKRTSPQTPQTGEHHKHHRTHEKSNPIWIVVGGFFTDQGRLRAEGAEPVVPTEAPQQRAGRRGPLRKFGKGIGDRWDCTKIWQRHRGPVRLHNQENTTARRVHDSFRWIHVSLRWIHVYFMCIFINVFINFICVHVFINFIFMQGFSCFFLIVTLTLTSSTVDRLFFLASTVCPYRERYWYTDLCENLAKFSCPKQKGLRENTPKGHWESTPRSPTTRATTKKYPKIKNHWHGDTWQNRFFLFVIAGTPRRLRLKEPSLLTWIANLSRGYPLLHCFGLHAVH